MVETITLTLSVDGYIYKQHYLYVDVFDIEDVFEKTINAMRVRMKEDGFYDKYRV